jgi:ribose 5-phosphate isomerase A
MGEDAAAAEEEKQAAALAAANLVASGMKVGLGTGTTAAYAIRGLAARVESGALRDLILVPTSVQTEELARDCGLHLTSLNDAAVGGQLDIVIDGADEVGPGWDLIKGGGGALLIEKVVAAAAERVVVIVDSSKLVGRLCERHPIPIEVVPAARLAVRRVLTELGFALELRTAQRKAGPVITDHGNVLFDARPPAGFDPAVTERTLCCIPGVVECGIFIGAVTDLIIGDAGLVRHLTEP